MLEIRENQVKTVSSGYDTVFMNFTRTSTGPNHSTFQYGGLTSRYS